MTKPFTDFKNSYHPVPKPTPKGKKEPKPVTKVGKKGKEDVIARFENKKYMEEIGITTCEAKLEGCWHNNALSFAHPDKRVHLTREDLRKAIVCCVPCHTIIEKWSREEMTTFIMNTIAERKL